MGSALKKTAHAAEQERPDVAARRLAWLESQPDLDPRRLVFIDETGASTKMARLRGRSKRGQRCRAAVPHGHWKATRAAQDFWLSATFLKRGSLFSRSSTLSQEASWASRIDWAVR